MIKKFIQWLVLLGIVAWFIAMVWDQRDLIVSQIRFVDAPLLGVSIAALGIVMLAQAWLWRALLVDFGYALSYSQTIQTLYVSSLGRYVPGRIWQFSSAIYLLRELGVPPETGALVAILAQLLTLVTGAVIALPVLAAWLQMSGLKVEALLSASAALVLVVAVVAFPNVWIRAVNRVLRWSRRREIHLDWTSRRVARYGLAYVIVWLANGVAFFLLIRSLYSIDVQLWPFTIAAYAFAYIVGYIAIFTPGGLGVREGAMVLALGLFLPASTASAVAIMSRFWFVFVELLAAVLGLILHTRAKTIKARVRDLP